MSGAPPVARDFVNPNKQKAKGTTLTLYNTADTTQRAFSRLHNVPDSIVDHLSGPT